MPEYRSGIRISNGWIGVMVVGYRAKPVSGLLEMILEKFCPHFHIGIGVQRTGRVAKLDVMVPPAYLEQANIDEQDPHP